MIGNLSEMFELYKNFGKKCGLNGNFAQNEDDNQSNE